MSSDSIRIVNYKSKENFQFEICLNFNWVQTLREKSHKFTKYPSGHDFNIVNLDGLNCIQKFEVPLQMAIKA
jgi:hypothetical protein